MSNPSSVWLCRGRALPVVVCVLAMTAGPARADLIEETGSPIAVGAEPRWVTSADFDGDGRMDLAVANDDSASPSGTVSILLRRPAGGFSAEATITVGQRPGALATADFDGDGRRDLAVANYVSNTVTVLLRTADNSGFAAEGPPIAVASSPHAVAAADVNDDGRIDLVTVSHALNSATVLLRRADNTGFVEEESSPVAVGSNPTQIAPADFNGDGRLDLATANLGSDDVTVLLRTADNNGFVEEAGTPSAAGDAPVGIVTADFDGDGRPDLAVAAQGSDDVTVLLRRADGGFAPAPGSPHPAGDGAYGLATGDLNADGRPDLAVTAFAANRVTLLHGTGTGAFVPPSLPSAPTAKSPLVPAAADFDADGRTDLAIPNSGANTVTVRLSRAGPDPAPVPAAPRGCLPPSVDRLALWRGENSARDSVGDHDGTLENGGAYRDGVIGRAFSLAGSDDYLHIPDRPALNLTGDATFEAWVQIDDLNFGTSDPYGVGGDRVIVAKSDATDSQLSFALWIEGDLPRTAQSAPLAYAGGPRSDPDTVVNSEALAWEQARWYHVAVVRSARAIRFYRDGTEVGTATVGGTPLATPAAPVSLGGLLYDATVFNPLLGGLDEAALWNRALSGGEVQAIVDTATGACAAPVDTTPPEPPITEPPAPPVNTARPRIADALNCPAQVNGGGCTIKPSSYRCDPGTWTGRDAARYYGFAWYRMVRDAAFVEGYRRVGTPVAYGEYFTAASESRLGMDPARWVFQCVTEAYNGAGTESAFSPPRQLSPKYDPLGEEFVYGDFAIRGIDVFQVVQPNASARAFGWDPARDADDNPLKDAGAAELAFGFDMAGGGTPTAFKRDAFGGGRLPGGVDPQRIAYEGVTLDANKPTVAVVYPSRKDLNLGSTSRYPLRITLRARVDGRPYDAPITREITSLQLARTPYVTGAQRDDPAFGQQFQLPGTWLVGARSGRLDLEARIEMVKGLGVDKARQCPGETSCVADDRFVLQGIPARTLPPLDLMGVRLTKTGNPNDETNLSLDEALVRPVREQFPGGQDMRAFTTAGEVPIGDILNPLSKYQPGNSECESVKDSKTPLRDCRQLWISSRLREWESTNSSLRPLYDIVLGVHDYVVGATIEPGWAIGPRLGKPKATRPPIAFINNGTASRPFTAVAHEVGHLLDLSHAGRQCPVPTGFSKNETGVGAAQQGEYWPVEDRGRLQGTAFDAARAPGRDLRSNPLDPATDLGPDPSSPATKDGDANADGSAAVLDFMSYCAPESKAWLSARNWNHTFGILAAYPGQTAAASGAGVARSAQAGSPRRALVIGVVGPAGAAVTRVIPPDAGLEIPAADASSPVRLRAYGPQGGLLADVGAAVEASSETSAPGAGTFAAAVPAGATAIEVMRGDNVLARVARSAPPTATLRAPRRRTQVRRGALTVRWTAADPDGDVLQARVQYSADDGRTFQTLTIVPAVGGRATVRGSKLTGSRRARIRVAISDGFSEVRLLSPRFRVAGSRPTAQIARPAAGERARSDGRMLLLGSGRDDAMRALRGRALRWYAGRRLLGSGARLSVRLPAGRQSVRLVATDRSGRTATARRTVRVQAPPLFFTRYDYAGARPAGARSLMLVVATSRSAVLRAGGRSHRIGPRAKRLRIALPARPARVRIPVTVTSGGRRLSGSLVVQRG